MFIRNPEKNNMDWNSFLKPFTAQIWAAFLAVILILSACIFINIKIGSKYGEVSENTSKLRVCDSLLYVCYSFCQQSKYANCFILMLSVRVVCHNSTQYRRKWKSGLDARTKCNVNKSRGECEVCCLFLVDTHDLFLKNILPPPSA
jgi:hypothetical protein